MQKSNEPSEGVKFWNQEWETSKDLKHYREQEELIERLFEGEGSGNVDFDNVLTKIVVLDSLYSTNLNKQGLNTYTLMAHKICKITDIDKRLREGDVDLVNEIANIEMDNRKRNVFSFATKFCAKHNRDAYFIYDNFVKKTLLYFQKESNFAKFRFTQKDLKDYPKFKEVMESFKKHYELKCTARELDIYLWRYGKQLGKENSKKLNSNKQ